MSVYAYSDPFIHTLHSDLDIAIIITPHAVCLDLYTICSIFFPEIPRVHQYFIYARTDISLEKTLVLSDPVRIKEVGSVHNLFL